MEIPPNISDATFEKEFVRGAILSTQMAFASGATKRKFLVVLNRQSADSESLLFLTTSQIVFYKKHPWVDRIQIPAGSLSCFPLETVIDCREVYTLLRLDLKKRYQQGALGFAGHLPSEIVERIDQIVAASRFISPRHKKTILGWS